MRTQEAIMCNTRRSSLQVINFLFIL